MSDAFVFVPTSPRSRNRGFVQPLTVAGLYAVLASLWIVLSDRALGWLVDDPALLLLLSTAKGWLFVAVSAALIFGLMVRRAAPAKTTPVGPSVASELPWWRLGLLGAAMLIGKLTVGGFLLALIETLSAKMRIFRAPEYLGTAFLLSVLAVLINLLLETK